MNIANFIINRVTQRTPDIQIGGSDDPYLNRWYVIPRNRFFNIYLHQFIRDDDDRAEHDHPWLSLSWMMRGNLMEFHSITQYRPIFQGTWTWRRARFCHRLRIPVDMSGKTWTLFITGPRIRQWGFHCPNGWVHWEKFTSGTHGETVGRGCDQ